jgi:spermidine synthase
MSARGAPRALLILLAGLLAVVGVVSPAAAAEPPAASGVSPTTDRPASPCTSDNLLAGKVPFASNDIEGDPVLVTDGAVSPEGASWDAPTAILLRARGSVTYDLGEAKTISALYVQADANDTYEVSGSTTGEEGSFTRIAEVDNVVDKGAGLRNRATRAGSTTVRYLRIGNGRGDGSYSISEFAAYCNAPSPFPPALSVVEGPKAEMPKGPHTTIGERTGTQARAMLFIAAAILLVFGIGGVKKPKKGEAPSADAAPAPSTERSLRLLFAASGCAALIYEVVWFHLLRLVIGASALSVGIVLASFMGGMFVGSLLFARYVPKDRPPLRVYAALELGIGVFGLLIPLILPGVRHVYVALVGYGPLGIALRALIAVILLLPPTALMGATLPAVARRYSASQSGMSSLSALYAANTIGAVIGSLASAFYLLAEWDVWVTTFAAAALNFIVAYTAFRLPDDATTTEAVDANPPEPDAESVQRHRALYAAAALSGLTALGAQVVWTRLLTLLFGATVYAFAIILAVFLAGLGIGSAFATLLLRRGANPWRALTWTQLALVPALLGGGYLLVEVLPYSSTGSGTPVRVLHALHVLRSVDVVLPGAVLWGMSLPLAFAAGSSSHGDTARSSGLIYAANTLGAIAGAIITSFWFIPAYGTQAASRFLVVLAGVSGALLIRALGGELKGIRILGQSVVVSPVGALGIGALAAALLPGLPTAFLAHGRYIWWVNPKDKYLYVSEGAASTVAVHVAQDGYRNFHVSGRVEATNNPADLRLERLLGHLSALSNSNPTNVLVVGLGAGVTAGAIAQHPEVKRLVICEIEPRVAGAARMFAPENYAVLDDPRVEVVFDDARHFLATTRERFDVITSDPIHPWVRGNSVLFSREYYAIVKSKLAPGGIATQWVPLYETSERAIQIQMRTFTDAFPNGTVWNSAVTGRGYDVVLLGRNEPLRLDTVAMQARLTRTPKIAQSLREVRINSIVDLLGTYATSGPDMQRWLADTPVNRDFSLKLEYISGMALNTDAADPIYQHMVADRTYPESTFVAPEETQAALKKRLLGEGSKPR